MGKPTPEQFMIYMNFVVYFIVGKVGNAQEIFAREPDAILVTSRYLMKKVIIQPVHRGLILGEPNLIEVGAHDKRSFLSFSGNLNVAKHFGDPDPQRGFGFGPIEMGAYPAWSKPSEGFFGHGYLITYKPKREEVLFHFNLFFEKPLVSVFIKLFEAIGITGRGASQLETFRRQKEVILLNKGQNFKVKPLEATPDYEDYAYGELAKQGWVVEKDENGIVTVYEPDGVDIRGDLCKAGLLKKL